MKERCLIFNQRTDDETQPWECWGALREAQQPEKWLIWIKTKPPKARLAPAPGAGGSRVGGGILFSQSEQGRRPGVPQEVLKRGVVA